MDYLSTYGKINPQNSKTDNEKCLPTAVQRKDTYIMGAIVTLKKGEGRLLKSGGAWIFDNEVDTIVGSFENGDIVIVKDFDGYPLGKGFINTNSKIFIRMLTRHVDTEIDEAFFTNRLQDAWDYRKKPVDTSSCRVVFGEADFLPGIVIDKFENVLVVESLALGIDKVKNLLINILKNILKNDGIIIEGVYERSDAKVRKHEGMDTYKGFIGDEFNTKVHINENGVRYIVDVKDGQKTGFFVDQRENRSLLERYAKDRSVLNMFCYTGGFSFYAMRGGAKLVRSVDSSAKAIDLTNKNVELNFPGDSRHEAFAEDAFKYLDRMGDQYDLIILDPPAFAKHKDALRNALQGYRKLNAKAFEKIKPGGILFTFSCSQVVSKDNFRTAVFTAAAMSGRSVRILHQLTQPADHPVNIYHPEGEYLKGLVLYVE